jgi:hypothetical protein
VLGAAVPLAGRALVGAAAGAVILALVALLFARPIVVALAGALGGVLVALALVAVLGARPLAADLVAHPLALVGVALVAAIAGAAFQLGRGDAAKPSSALPSGATPRS